MDVINDLLNEDAFNVIFNRSSFQEKLKLRIVCKKWYHLINSMLRKEKSLSIIQPGRLHLRGNYSPSWHSINDYDPSSKEYIYPYSIHIEPFRSILVRCENLAAIDLIHVQMNDELMSALTESCPNIQHLDLGFCTRLSYHVVELITKTWGHKLKHLVVCGCELNERHISLIIENCPQLEHFDASDNTLVIGDCLANLPETIRELNIKNCDGFQCSAIESLCEGGGKNIKKLSIGGFSYGLLLPDLILPQLCRNLKNLKKLECSIKISNENSEENLLSISLLKDLEELLIYYTTDHVVYTITDKILKSIIVSCPKLKRLELIEADEGVNVTDESLSLLPNCCPAIERLVFDGFIYISRNSLLTFSKLKNLWFFEVAHSTGVDDVGVEVLLKNCLLIRHLRVSFCPNVTNLSANTCIEVASERPKINIVAKFLKTQAVPDAMNILPPNLILEIQ